MAYPEKLLSDGETVVFEMRPHWRALLIPGIIFLAVLFGLFFLLRLFVDSFSGALGTVGTWATWLVALFIVIVFVLRPILYWLTTQYVFTNRRIIVRSGLIARHGRDMPLSKVNNVSFDVTAGGRILNYGTLTIDSASDEALVINDVPDVEHIQREVNRLHEEDDEGRRRAMYTDFAQAAGAPLPPPVQQPPVTQQPPAPTQPVTPPPAAPRIPAMPPVQPPSSVAPPPDQAGGPTAT